MAVDETRALAAVRVGTDLLAMINARIIEYRAIRDAMAASQEGNAVLVARAAEIENEIEQLKADISAIIAANIPGHQWNGTLLRLMNVDGSWGAFVDLRGAPGQDGEDGDIGPQGKSAYQIAVDQGFEGTRDEWLETLVGPKGDQGQNFQVDATGNFASRGGYDAAASGFAYLSTNGDGGSIATAVIYIKQSSASGDWSAPIPFQGPVGPQGPMPTNSDQLTEGTTNLLMTTSERTKLADLPSGADLQESLDGKATAAQGEAADSAVQPGAALIAALEALAPLLPTSKPSAPGKVWINGGIFMLSYEE